jgi:hypothetical protein
MTEAPARKKWKRPVAVVAVLAVVALVVLIGGLPQWLSTPRARRWLLAKANAALAPGRLEVGSFRFSWFGPTRMTRIVLLDPQGDRVVEAPSATWDRDLRKILFDRPRYGTLRLDRAVLDVERGRDGSVDLYEALRPILREDPDEDLTIRVVQGSLRFRDHMRDLLRPVKAERADLVLHLAPRPKALTWRLDLRNSGNDPNDAEELTVIGRLDRFGPGGPGQKDLAIRITGNRWPVDVSTPNLTTFVRLVGHVELMRHEDLWSFAGDARFRDIALQGSWLSGDHLDWPEARGRWNVAQTGQGWAVRSLDLEGPIGSVHARGTLPSPSEESVIEGQIDLAKLAQQLPHALHLPHELVLERGRAQVRAEAKPSDAGLAWKLEGRILDLAANRGDERIAFSEPGVVTASLIGVGESDTQFDARVELGDSPWSDGPLGVRVAAVYRAKADELEISRFEVKERRGTLAAQGRVCELGKRRLAELEGTITPDWREIEATLARHTDPNARLEGESITFRAKGPLSSPWNDMGKALDADVRFALASADVYGLRVGPTALTGHSSGGRMTFDPIDTTLNGGRVHLEPRLETREDGGFTLLLSEGSSIRDAEVNDEVSHRFLSFVVPVMDQATRVHGRVSVDLERAEFPLGEGASQKAVVEGRVVFRDVEFVARGPLAHDIFALMGNSNQSTLRLDQPVVLSISEGKIHQRGLAVPIPIIKTQFELAGWIDFDRNLALTASLPLTPQMFEGLPLLADVIGGTRINVPVGGTLSQPKVDKESFRVALKETGKDLLQRGAMRGAAELLFRLTQPRDPNDPPPMRLTPEERRQRRLERREERRQRREQP